MQFLPQEIWAEIAYTQELQSEWCKEMFNTPDEFLNDELERETRFLKRLGYTNKVVLAFHYVLPLLLEHQAITRYISMKDDIGLRNVLPEILDAEEAVEIMRLEFNMHEDDAVSLHLLLTSITNNYIKNG